MLASRLCDTTTEWDCSNQFTLTASQAAAIYSMSQLVRLNHILALKDLDFSLDQIQELLKMELSGDGLFNMLTSKANELRRRITDLFTPSIRLNA
ncbi:MAG: MerR family DNA-binding protein [Chloroflexota bacterium]|nr:MerR family DNA-binding protein [Chloroflexota bacterium]